MATGGKVFSFAAPI